MPSPLVHSEEYILSKLFDATKRVRRGAVITLPPNHTAIMALACKAQYWQVMRALIDLGADSRGLVNQLIADDDVERLTHVAYLAGAPKGYIRLSYWGHSMRPLFLINAAHPASPRVFHRLIADGGLPDDDERGFTRQRLLAAAAVGGDLTIFTAVIDAAAAAEPARSRRELFEALPQPGTHGAAQSLLFYALASGRAATVAAIMEHVSGAHVRMVLDARNSYDRTALEVLCRDVHLGANEPAAAAAARAVLSKATPVRVPAWLLARDAESRLRRPPLVERCGMLSNPILLRLFIDTAREAAAAVDAAAGEDGDERATTAAGLSGAAWRALARLLNYSASVAKMSSSAAQSMDKGAETLRLLLEIVAADIPGLAGLAEQPPRVEPAAARAAALRLAAEWHCIDNESPYGQLQGPPPPRESDGKDPSLAVAARIIVALSQVAEAHPLCAGVALALALALAPPCAPGTPADVKDKWQVAAKALALRMPDKRVDSDITVEAQELIKTLGGAGALPSLFAPGAGASLPSAPAGLCPVCWQAQSPACEPACAGLRTVDDSTDALLLHRMLAAAAVNGDAGAVNNDAGTSSDGTPTLLRGLARDPEAIVRLLAAAKPLTLSVLIDAGLRAAAEAGLAVWRLPKEPLYTGPARRAAALTVLLRARAAAPGARATDPAEVPGDDVAAIWQRISLSPLNIVRILVACEPVRAVAAAVAARGAIRLPLSTSILTALCNGGMSEPAVARACFSLLTTTATEELAGVPNSDQHIAWLLGHAGAGSFGGAALPLARAATKATGLYDAWEPVVQLLRAGAPYRCDEARTILHVFLGEDPVRTSHFAGVSLPLRAVLEAVRDAESRREALAGALRAAGHHAPA